MARGADAIRDAVTNAAPAEDDDAKSAGSRDLRLARRELNDKGNGERLRTRYGRNLMFVREFGRLNYTGSHWSAKTGAKEWALAAQKTQDRMAAEAAELVTEEGVDPKRVAEYRAWRTESGNQPRLNAMQNVSEPHLEFATDELDVDPFLFNVQNGTLELGTAKDPAVVRLRKHSRLDRITRIAPIGYDPDAKCDAFRRFLDRVMPDQEVQHWLQRWFGYCLTADYGEQKLAAFWGEGRNGKGVLSKLIMWVLGDYASILQFVSLLDDTRKRGSEATPDWARLPGVRAVFAGEPKKGARLDDGLIKQLTGGDDMPVRKLNKDFFDLRPTFKFTLSFNNKPQIRDDTYGLWRRVNLVPFSVMIPEDEVDPHILDKLKREGPGVLNWLLDGFRLWREYGLAAPQAILAATDEYRSESDRFGLFIDAAIDKAPGRRIRSADLYDCYKGFAEAMEFRPISQTMFGKELNKRGIIAAKDGVMYRLDIKFKPDIDWEWARPM
jgi:putative DNA primase/helicase